MLAYLVSAARSEESRRKKIPVRLYQWLPSRRQTQHDKIPTLNLTSAFITVLIRHDVLSSQGFSPPLKLTAVCLLPVWGAALMTSRRSGEGWAKALIAAWWCNLANTDLWLDSVASGFDFYFFYVLFAKLLIACRDCVNCWKCVAWFVTYLSQVLTCWRISG